MKWHLFFISDGTGITAEAVGHSLLTQFPNLNYQAKTRPFVKNETQLQDIVVELQEIRQLGEKTLVFSTLINHEFRQRLQRDCDAYYDLFETFTGQFAKDFGMESTKQIGLSHSLSNKQQYQSRIDAINFSLWCDDGNGSKFYQDADVIIIGVSRSGKTPTSLYMAMTFAIHTANYPLSDEELSTHQLPVILQEHRDKLFGLTIDPLRLQAIRSERRPNSQYSQLKTCRQEIQDLEYIYRQYKLPYLDASTHSVEEISSKIVEKMQLKR